MTMEEVDTEELVSRILTLREEADKACEDEANGKYDAGFAYHVYEQLGNILRDVGVPEEIIGGE